MKSVCGLALVFACSVLPAGNRPSPAPLVPPSTELQSLRTKSYNLLRSGRRTEAIDVFQQGLRLSQARSDSCSAAWFLNGLAGAYFGLYRYRDALATYLDQRPWAERCGDPVNLGILHGNIASLYTATGTGDIAAAGRAADEALALLKGPKAAPFRANVLITRARIDARRNSPDASLAGFAHAIDEAARFADPVDRESWNASVRIQATAWKELGEELLATGNYTAAEDALDNSYRLQVLNHIPPSAVTFRLLAELRRLSGDLPNASRLIDRAIEQAVSLGPRVPMWRLYYERGRIHLARKDLPAALRDFETSLDFIRRFRVEFLPADSFRISNENYLHDVYAAYVNTCNQLHFERNRPNCALKSFEVAEENRAVSLRDVLYAPDDWRGMLTDKYLDQLDELESASRAMLRSPTPELRGRMDRLQAQLTEDELKAGIRAQWLQPVPPGRILPQIRKSLRPDEALLAFSVGEEQSYLWTVTRSGVTLHRLAPKARLEDLGRAFQQAVAASSPGAVAAGEALYRELFGQISPRVAAKPRWILVLDQGLFHVPHAALVAGRSHNRPVYLIEKHSLQQVPAAGVLAARLTSSQDPPTSPERFVAVGDAVYNRADDRWPRKPAAPQGQLPWLGSILASERDPRSELPRLPGSGNEIQACARLWGETSPAVILAGMDANPTRLDEVLRQPVSVLHIAAHFVPRQGASLETQIALSLDPSGKLRFLSEREIYARRLPVCTVVLSGCSSGDGYALPASGLLGMTRAWLAAGAHSVAASLWPTVDDTGELFTRFYRNLRSLRRSGVADPDPVALQQAQLALLRSHSWRQQPAHWAAYFIVTKD